MASCGRVYKDNNYPGMIYKDGRECTAMYKDNVKVRRFPARNSENYEYALRMYRVRSGGKRHVGMDFIDSGLENTRFFALGGSSFTG